MNIRIKKIKTIYNNGFQGIVHGHLGAHKTLSTWPCGQNYFRSSTKTLFDFFQYVDIHTADAKAMVGNTLAS